MESSISVYNIPLDDSVLYYLYQAVGLDPATCSEFTRDMMSIAGFVTVALIFVGCLCLFGWFLKLARR